MQRDGENDRLSLTGISGQMLIAIRVVLLGTALLSAAFTTIFGDTGASAGVEFFYLPVAILFAFSLISALWLKRRRASATFDGLQLLADGFIVTAIIYITGGADSPFQFLYIPVVILSSIRFSRAGGLVAVVCASGMYATLLASLDYGIVPTPDGSTPVPHSIGGVIFQLLGLGSAMVLVAIGTDFLLQRLRTASIQAQHSSKALAELSTAQATLIDGISEGLVQTDLELRIKSINSAACSLLGIQRQEWEGRRFQDLLKARCVELPELSRLSQQELSIKSSDRDEIKAIFHGRYVQDLSGTNVGFIFTLRDVTVLRSVEEQLQLQEKMARLLSSEGAAVQADSCGNLIGESAVMKKVFSVVRRVAQSDATVLVSGESGTGKELVARAIHGASARARGNFVAVNCGAIPENLIESELFGHKKGAFTGADRDTIGLFRQADGGTIFLDEIGELPLSMQAKMLRVLQDRTVRPVGGTSDIPVNLRIVAATNRKLRAEVAAGRFREDLYFRLNVVGVTLPPLRDRKEDLPVLVQAILKKLIGPGVVPVVPAATMELINAHSFPGNVRELENILERAVVLGGEVILPEHLDFSSSGIGNATTETQIIISDDITFPCRLEVVLEALEKRYLEAALEKSGGAKKKAAELLGINFRSFRYRLGKLGLSEVDEVGEGKG
jgi:two-component system response regulator PilR (NtrC family)